MYMPDYRANYLWLKASATNYQLYSESLWYIEPVNLGEGLARRSIDCIPNIAPEHKHMQHFHTHLYIHLGKYENVGK